MPVALPRFNNERPVLSSRLHVGPAPAPVSTRRVRALALSIFSRLRCKHWVYPGWRGWCIPHSRGSRGQLGAARCGLGPCAKPCTSERYAPACPEAAIDASAGSLSPETTFNQAHINAPRIRTLLWLLQIHTRPHDPTHRTPFHRKDQNIRYALTQRIAHPWARDADLLVRLATHGRRAMPRWRTRGRRSERYHNPAPCITWETQGAGRGVPTPASKRFDDQFFKSLAVWALPDTTCRQILD